MVVTVGCERSTALRLKSFRLFIFGLSATFTMGWFLLLSWPRALTDPTGTSGCCNTAASTRSKSRTIPVTVEASYKSLLYSKKLSLLPSGASSSARSNFEVPVSMNSNIGSILTPGRSSLGASPLLTRKFTCTSAMRLESRLGRTISTSFSNGRECACAPRVTLRDCSTSLRKVVSAGTSNRNTVVLMKKPIRSSSSG